MVHSVDIQAPTTEMSRKALTYYRFLIGEIADAIAKSPDANSATANYSGHGHYETVVQLASKVSILGLIKQETETTSALALIEERLTEAGGQQMINFYNGVFHTALDNLNSLTLSDRQQIQQKLAKRTDLPKPENIPARFKVDPVRII